MKNVFATIKAAIVEVSRVEFRNLLDGRATQFTYAIVPVWITMFGMWALHSVQPQYQHLVGKMLSYTVAAGVLHFVLTVAYTTVRQLYVQYTLNEFKRIEQQKHA